MGGPAWRSPKRVALKLKLKLKLKLCERRTVCSPCRERGGGGGPGNRGVGPFAADWQRERERESESEREGAFGEIDTKQHLLLKASALLQQHTPTVSPAHVLNCR